MTLADHLKELKFRLIISLMVTVIAIGISYCFADEIFKFLFAPLTDIFVAEKLNRKLIYTNLTEAFFTKVRIAVTCGILLTLPIIMWHCYRFVAPGLFKRERFAFVPYLVFSPILFFMGAYLAYGHVMPMAWRFFMSFEQDFSSVIPLVFEAKISEYISLVTTMVIAFGLVFQLPLILVLLVQVGLLSVAQLVAFRRHAIVVTFIIGAIVTPPDTISQITLAVPLILLYEISILICKRIKIKTRIKS